MNYRDQLDYIKSHKIADDDEDKKKKDKKEKKKLGDEPYDERYDTEYYVDLEAGLLDDDLETDRPRKSSRNREKAESTPKSTRSGNGGGAPPAKKKKKTAGSGIDGFDQILFLILVICSTLFMASMLVLGIFPWIYVAAALVIVILVVAVVRHGEREATYRKHSRHRILAIVCSALFLILGIFMFRIDGALGEIAKGDSTRDVSLTPYNIYISGMDTYGEISESSRSDVNLIATMNPNTHQMLLTTTPRDYYVVIPGYSEGQYDKLTHAGNYGVEASVATLENLYDIEIPFYIRVNFTSVIDLVDLLGGVTVNSEVAFTTSKAAGEVVDIQEGSNHLNGAQALAFARERKAFKEGDNQRGKNQQALLVGILKSAISPMTIVRSNSIIESMTKYVDTNLSKSQLKAMIRQQLDIFNRWDSESVAATGSDDNRYCYSYSGGPLYVCIPSESSVAEIKAKMQECMQE